MRKAYLSILFTCISFNIFAMKLDGNPSSWSEEDFIGFDQVGDCLSSIGDISSVFTVVEDNSLLLRVTFDGMLDRQFGLDKFDGEDIHALLLGSKILPRRSCRATRFWNMTLARRKTLLCLSFQIG